MAEHELAQHALAYKPSPKKSAKPLREIHVRELHDGTHHIAKHDGKGGVTEHNAKHLHEVHAHLDAHMGEPNAGEEEMEGGTGSAAEEAAEGE